MDRRNLAIAAASAFAGAALLPHKVAVSQPGPTSSAQTEQCVDTMADLRNLAAGAVRCLTLLGYYAPSDGGGGVFYWDGSATEADNAGTIIAPNPPSPNPPQGRWKRVIDGPISVKWFGAKTNNVPATGTITCVGVTGSDLVSGNGGYFTMSDGEVKTIFEFDIGNGVASGNVAIPISASDTPADIATRIATTINAVILGNKSKIIASVSRETVNITSQAVGAAGNAVVSNSSGLINYHVGSSKFAVSDIAGGADGDNDYQALVDAIAAAQAHRADLYIPPGHYLIQMDTGYEMLIAGKLRMFGLNRDQTWLHLAGTGPAPNRTPNGNFSWLQFGTASNGISADSIITIEGLTISGPTGDLANGPIGNGIVMGNGTVNNNQMTIRGCRFDSFPAALKIDDSLGGSYYAVLEDSIITAWGGGIGAWEGKTGSASHFIARNCSFYNPDSAYPDNLKGHCLYLSYGTNYVIDSCRFLGTTYSRGFQINNFGGHLAADYQIVTNSSFTGPCGGDIHVGVTQKCQITNCYFEPTASAAQVGAAGAEFVNCNFNMLQGSQQAITNRAGIAPGPVSAYGCRFYGTPAVSCLSRGPTAITVADEPGGATQSGSSVTITTTSPHSLIPGVDIFVRGVAVGGAEVAGYNGHQIVQNVPSSTTFTYTVAFHGLPDAGGGIVSIPWPARFDVSPSPSGATQSGYTVTVTTTTPHSLFQGAPVMIKGVAIQEYNGLQIVQSVPNATQFTYSTVIQGLAKSGGGVVLLGRDALWLIVGTRFDQTTGNCYSHSTEVIGTDVKFIGCHFPATLGTDIALASSGKIYVENCTFAPDLLKWGKGFTISSANGPSSLYWRNNDADFYSLYDDNNVVGGTVIDRGGSGGYDTVGGDWHIVSGTTFVDVTGYGNNPVTLTLPKAAKHARGFEITIKDGDGNVETAIKDANGNVIGSVTITVEAFVGDSIDDGSSSVISAKYGVLRLRSDGNLKWLIV